MKNKPYRYLLYLGLRLLESIVCLLPRSLALFLAAMIAKLAFLVARRERKKTILHLSLAYGEEKSFSELRSLAERVFIHFGRVAVDVLRVSKLNLQMANRWIDKGDGLSRFDQVLSEGKGGILLTGHLGNWEWMGAYLMLHGYPGAVVGKRLYYEKFNEAIIRLREKVTLRTIYQDASPRELLKVLKQNWLLGILADQDVDRLEGIFVPFFGRPAYTLTTPVRLALASGAPIIPAFLIRKGDRYQLEVEEPIRVEMAGTREETIQKYTERWSRMMEEKIRAYPDQWAWMHRRWKTQAPETAASMEVS